MNKTSITALMSAFGRAYHTQNAENPIFPDTKVRELMTDEEYNMIAGYILSGIDFFAPDKKDSLGFVCILNRVLLRKCYKIFLPWLQMVLI